MIVFLQCNVSDDAIEDFQHDDVFIPSEEKDVDAVAFKETSAKPTIPIALFSTSAPHQTRSGRTAYLNSDSFLDFEQEEDAQDRFEKRIAAYAVDRKAHSMCDVRRQSIDSYRCKCGGRDTWITDGDCKNKDEGLKSAEQKRDLGRHRYHDLSSHLWEVRQRRQNYRQQLEDRHSFLQPNVVKNLETFSHQRAKDSYGRGEVSASLDLGLECRLNMGSWCEDEVSLAEGKTSGGPQSGGTYMR